MAADDKVNPRPNTGLRLKEEEIFSGLGPTRGSLLFLGRYTLKEVMVILARKGFLREARKRNLWPLSYRLDSSDYPVQRLLIYWEKEDPDRIIVDLKIKERRTKVLDPEKHGYRLPVQHTL